MTKDEQPAEYGRLIEQKIIDQLRARIAVLERLGDAMAEICANNDLSEYGGQQEINDWVEFREGRAALESGTGPKPVVMSESLLEAMGSDEDIDPTARPPSSTKTFTVERVLAAWDSMALDNPHLFNEPGKAWRDALRRALGFDGGGK